MITLSFNSVSKDMVPGCKVGTKWGDDKITLTVDRVIERENVSPLYFYYTVQATITDIEVDFYRDIS